MRDGLPDATQGVCMTEEQKKGVGCILAGLHIVLVTPIWYYLLFRVLQAVNADTSMWVAYWVYIPIGVLLASIKAVWDN